MKTVDLTGTALDWAVAKVEGMLDSRVTISRGKIKFYDGHLYNPSESWELGGPIIEREIHKLWRNLDGTFCAQIKYRVPYYSPTYDADIGADAYINKHGISPLEAAMRCYVTHKLGSEIEVPDDITQTV